VFLVVRLDVLGGDRRYYAIPGFVCKMSIVCGVGLPAESWFHKGGLVRIGRSTGCVGPLSESYFPR
jgi:hypothetical protein